MTEIKMPRLSDSMQEGTIVTWLQRGGELVAEGDELVEIETDKATMAYESPAAGVLAIVAAVGETLPVGAMIATVGDGAPLKLAPVAVAVAAAEPVAEAVAEPAPDGNSADPGRVRATPLARRLAREHGVDLSALQGTGPGGRITRSDVESRRRRPVKRRANAINAARRRYAGADAPPTGRRPPHVGVQGDDPALPGAGRGGHGRADRTSVRAQGARRARGAGPSVNDFIVKACALALRDHPRANGSYRDGRFELHAAVNVGIAVAAPDALVVPTVTDADRRSLREIATESRRLAERVRDGKITPPELSGATFTVSNLGMYGMTAITPVINPPQAAILGVGAARAVPALEDGRLVERHLMTLTLSCDHRILYGADAAQFLSDIRDALEAPLRLMLRSGDLA